VYRKDSEVKDEATQETNDKKEKSIEETENGAARRNCSILP